MVRKKFRAARRNKKLTQQKLGELVGVSQNAISNYESGNKSPSLNVAQKLATVLDHPIDELFNG